ncbi:hypothetical protein CC2G_012457 [Coprinopsis cinerea AmutBmut pab1-1]|nr:hypothetical protein CC2G_012457 [Coprinopsis cinerea AmutBmut pab1-1]
MSKVQKLGYSSCAALAALLLLPWILVYKRVPTLRWIKSRRVERQILRLSHLPPEILVEIMKHIEWSDVLSLRRCCRTLHSVSKDREVWLLLLRRYYDTVIPRPFFLSKPLELCSGDDLEARVVQWWTGWEGLRPTVQTFTTDANMSDNWGPLCPLPGDQFFLYKGTDGSIFYCNPGQPDAPMHLLVPSPYPSNYSVEVCVAVDVLGTQGIDGAPTLSSDWSFEHRLFPPAFRLAVCRYARRTGSIEIWEIRPEVEGGAIGYSSHLLKSFSDKVRPTCCSLLGDHVAYHSSSASATRIVDWTAVADEGPVLGVNIALSSPFYILLLPHRRILVHSSYIYLVDWKLCHQSESSPTSRIRPQWQSTERFRKPHPYSIPFYIDNSIRLIWYRLQSRALTGVIISNDLDVAVSDSIAFAQLAECSVPVAHDELWFDYRKGLCVFRKMQRAHLLCYKWPGDSLPEPSFSEIAFPQDTYTIYVDKAHARSRVVMFIYKRPCKTAFFG